MERFKHKNLQKFQILNGAQLKYIAFGSMLIDHINKALIWPNLEGGGGLSLISSIFDVIGRIAFPLFSFFVVEGFFRTHDKKKYLINLIFFAFISEVPYDMFSSKVILEFRLNNVLFSLALSLITIWILDEFRKRYEDKLGKFWLLISIPLLIIMYFVSNIVSGDYDFHAIITAFVFYLLYNRPVAGAVIAYLTIVKEVWSILEFRKRYEDKLGKFWLLISIPLLIIMYFVSNIVSGDYDFHAIITAFVFYLLYNRPVAGAVIAYLTIVKEVWSILGFGLTILYNGEKGRQNKIFNYLFYPVHLLILGLLRFYFNI